MSTEDQIEKLKLKSIPGGRIAAVCDILAAQQEQILSMLQPPPATPRVRYFGAVAGKYSNCMYFKFDGDKCVRVMSDGSEQKSLLPLEDCEDDISRGLMRELTKPEALARLDNPKAENTAETLARKFHETYERLAPSFGYETRKDTKAFDPNSPNGKLMIAVCGELGIDAADLERIEEAKRAAVDTVLGEVLGMQFRAPDLSTPVVNASDIIALREHLSK